MDTFPLPLGRSMSGVLHGLAVAGLMVLLVAVVVGSGFVFVVLFMGPRP